MNTKMEYWNAKLLSQNEIKIFYDKLFVLYYSHINWYGIAKKKFRV